MNWKVLLIILGMATASGAAKAIQDTITHHYSQSIFKQAGQWWNPSESWKAKYKDWDHGDKQPAFPLATTWLVSLTDAWHAFGLVHRATLLLAGIAGGLLAGQSYGYGWAYWKGTFIWFVVILFTGAISFHLFYTYIFLHEGTV